MHPRTETKRYRDQFDTEWSSFGVWQATNSLGYRLALSAEVDGEEVVVLVNEDRPEDVYHLIEEPTTCVDEEQ